LALAPLRLWASIADFSMRRTGPAACPIGTPLVIEDAPDPTLGTGEVIVDVVAAKVLAYANEVFKMSFRCPMAG
jgi:hypothetical protein